MATCRFCEKPFPADADTCLHCGAPVGTQRTLSPEELESEVESLMKEHRTLDAVNLNREETGVGVPEAKRAVEAFAVRQGLHPGRSGCTGRLAALLLVCCVCCVPAMTVIGRAAEDAPALDVPPLPGAVQIDGKLDEPCYQTPPIVSEFVVAGSPETRPQPTAAWLFWHPERLVFAFAVQDAEIVAAPPSTQERDVDPQDRAEIFLWSGRPDDTYYCIEVGALGAVHDYSARFYREFDDSWTPAGMQVAVTRTGTGYCIEGELPRAALEAAGFALRAGVQFHCGLFRADFHPARPDDPTWICWVDARGREPDFHVAESFGVIRLVGEPEGPERKVLSTELHPDAGTLVLASGAERMEVSLHCPLVQLAGGAGMCGGEAPTQVTRGDGPESSWLCSYPAGGGPAAFAHSGAGDSRHHPPDRRSVPERRGHNGAARPCIHFALHQSAIHE